MGASVTLNLHRNSDWSGIHVGVLGVGIAGFSAADALMQLGADVTIIDSSDGEKQQEKATILGSLGASVALGVQALPEIPFALIVTSPGLQPDHIFHRQALDRGIPIWGELELAWQLRHPSSAAEWLCVTGTNGKTTTTLMLESMLREAGFRTVSAGNIGYSLVDVVMHDLLDVIAVEVGAPQLPFVNSMSPWASACLNLAEDHLDHFGDFTAYRNAKARVYERTQFAAVYNDQDLMTLEMVKEANVIEGCRAVGFTRGIPGVSMLGVVDGAIVDRAFIADRRDSAQELALVSDIKPGALHNTENALAAAALARAFGESDRGEVSPAAIRAGIRNYQPASHRIQHVREVNGVTYIDDSKATNAHAAHMSLSSYPSVVWIAGGLAKGQDFHDLVRLNAQRMRAVILMGTDAHLLEEALSRHAPNVPVFTLVTRETSAMEDAVSQASQLAVPGDTVLLAPGCASWDMFTDYSHRGNVFAEAVHRIGEQ
jgi:UDP-N-acetylmuramoylalanine--D-glutamate ligase